MALSNGYTRMKDSPEFAIEFVGIIERYPCIWNSSLKDYSKRDIIDRSWKAISEQVEDTEANCRERWKNIRCAFVRSERDLSRDTGKRKRVYYLYNHLKFLLPYTRGKGTSIPPLQAHETNSDDYPKTCDDNESNTEIASSNDIDTFASVNMKSAPPVLYTQQEMFQSSTPVKQEAQVFAEEPVVTQCSSMRDHLIENADLLFFRSLLPDIDKLTAKNKRKFRKKVMNALDELLDETEDSQYTVTQSTNSFISGNF